MKSEKWHQVCPGLYCVGNIYVERIWHSDGVFAGNYMWHIGKEERTIQKWAYLKDAKRAAHKMQEGSPL